LLPQDPRRVPRDSAMNLFSLRVSRRGGAAVRFAPRTAACPAPRGLPRHRDSMRGWRLNAGSTFDIDGAP
ncbi:hypothetical protein, partial [Burkholderia mallei]|uniref:hypothetical protein n=1 Tax=Burkholderia mallei TaxID=13373 RepID=UPI001C0C63C3